MENVDEEKPGMKTITLDKNEANVENESERAKQAVKQRHVHHWSKSKCKNGTIGPKSEEIRLQSFTVDVKTQACSITEVETTKIHKEEIQVLKHMHMGRFEDEESQVGLIRPCMSQNGMRNYPQESYDSDMMDAKLKDLKDWHEMNMLENVRDESRGRWSEYLW